MSSIGDRHRGALVGALVGDCVGAPVEGHQGPVPGWMLDLVEHGDEPLPYTDDSAMTFALAESLLTSGGVDEDHVAATFARHYRQEPHRGYGAGSAELLRQVADGADWRRTSPALFGGQGSRGNGAAMRVAPVALLAQSPAERYTAERVAKLARRTAVVTHSHTLGVEGAAVQAGAVALALSGNRDTQLNPGEFLDALTDATDSDEFRDRLRVVGDLVERGATEEIGPRLGCAATALESVPTAICVFLLHPDSYRDAVRLAVSLGGDTDTIASMTGAAVGARVGAVGIPPAWMHRSEDTTRMIELADRFTDVSGTGIQLS